jgi:hypothetical protein
MMGRQAVFLVNTCMFEFIQLLEKQMHRRLLEQMTNAQAREIMLRYGANSSDLLPNRLRNTWVRLAQQYHPDRTGGDSDALALINAAHDVLKNAKPIVVGMHASPATPPVWQTDSRSAYNSWSREDYNDANWFKKRMWELSQHSTHRWTIYAFDGRFFRSSITVFGNSKIFDHMAQAMVRFNSHGGNPYHTEAVFVQDKDHPDVIILVWNNGRLVKPPVPLEHESPNANPSNDVRFMQQLPQTLEEIATRRDRMESFPGIAAALGRYRAAEIKGVG